VGESEAYDFNLLNLVYIHWFICSETLCSNSSSLKIPVRRSSRPNHGDYKTVWAALL